MERNNVSSTAKEQLIGQDLASFALGMVHVEGTGR